MPPKTIAPMPTRDEIEQEAAAAEQRAAALREQLWREDQAKIQRQYEAQARWDEDFADSVSRTALDADVDQARAALDQALADDPTVQALAGYLAALRRRSHMILEHNGALS